MESSSLAVLGSQEPEMDSFDQSWDEVPHSCIEEVHRAGNQGAVNTCQGPGKEGFLDQLQHTEVASQNCLHRSSACIGH